MHEYEIYSFTSNASTLVFSGGELKTKETDHSKGHGVRVLDGSRLGFCHCQKDSDLKKAIDEAKAASRFSVKSGFSFASKSHFTTPKIFDKSADPTDFSSLKSVVDEVKAAAESYGGRSRVIYSLETSIVRIENTSGFFGEYSKSLFSLYAECMYGDGFGFAYHSSNNKLKSPSEIGLKAATMAKDMRDAKKPESGSYTLVMEVEALESILDPLLSSFSGDWKRRGITKVKKTKMFSDLISIYEDGLAPAIDARPFDDEGSPSRRKKLVENGHAKSFLYDRETAALSNLSESGCCSRSSYSSAPTITPSNIVIDKGKCKNLAEFGKHIELVSAHGSHTANLTSGDIGLEVSTAFLVENNEKKPIKGFMISANIFDLFANIEAVESKQKTYGSLIAPRIAFGDVKVVS